MLDVQRWLLKPNSAPCSLSCSCITKRTGCSFDSDCDDDGIYGESDVHVCQCETLTQI